MWKKLQANLTREQKIGLPTLVETTLDQGILESITGNPAKGSRSVAYNDDSKELPPLPPKDGHPANRQRDMNFDSSLPPQIPSPRAGVQVDKRSKSLQPLPALPGETPDRQEFQERVSRAEITPPVSPLSIPSGRHEESPDVSPIQEEFDSPFGGNTSGLSKFDSRLPVPKRLVSDRDHTEKPPPASTLSDGTPTYPQHHPTLLRKDLSASMEARGAGSGILNKTRLANAPPGSQDIRINAPNTGSHQGRKLSGAFSYFSKSSSDREPLTPPREPWKGASGRAPLIAPIKTKTSDKARNLYSSLARRDHGNREDPHYPARGSSMSENLEQVPQETGPQHSMTDSTGDSKTPTQVSFSEALSSIPEPPSPTTSSRYSRYTAPRTPTKLDADMNPANPSRSPKSGYISRLTDLNAAEQPGSRFSVTTYATTEAGNSPRQSVDYNANDHPLPALPEPIISKPVGFGTPGALRKSTQRKPTPSFNSSADPPSLKDINAIPPLTQTQSRINAFETRRAELARRKVNIESMLYELTQAIQPSSTTYDMATRGEVKKAVASLKSELDDIRREDHEIGVKLIRAWKKLEDSESYDLSTSLWVKRVTT